MPVLRNPRHERFALGYHKTGNARRSYHAAGYKARMPRDRTDSAPVDANASRLLKHAKVKARLAELGRGAMKRNEITVDSLLTDLETDRALAHCEGQGSAAVQATMAKARLLGLIVDRKETGKPGEFEGLQTADDVIKAVRTEFGDKVADALAQELATHEEAGQEVRRRSAAKPPTNSGSGSLQ